MCWRGTGPGGIKGKLAKGWGGRCAGGKTSAWTVGHRGEWEPLSL